LSPFHRFSFSGGNDSRFFFGLSAVHNYQKPNVEMQTSFKTSKYPATLLFETQRIIGFCSISIDETDPSLGEVHMIGLHPEYRRKQLGNLLLGRALSELEDFGANKFKLTVAAKNMDALHLYEKFGFQIVDRDHCLRYSPLD